MHAIYTCTRIYIVLIGEMFACGAQNGYTHDVQNDVVVVKRAMFALLSVCISTRLDWIRG